MNEYIEVINQIKPKNNQSFAIADVNDLRGGYIQVETISEMQAFLSTNKLKEGMLCYVKTVTDNVHIYQYYNGTWNQWGGQGGSGSGGMSLKVVAKLSDLNNPDLKITGQIVFVTEVNSIRYYNGSIWESFSKIYIQSTAPEDKGGIWIDTSEEKEYLDSNSVIQNLLQVIAILQEEVKRLHWAFDSQMDFGNFTNNKYYEYDNSTPVEPTYGTSESSDTAEESTALLTDTVNDVEPTDDKNLLPNGRHLCIKSGTYSEMLTNKADFLPKELLWCYDTKTLWIKDPNTLNLIQIGSSTTAPDETMEQILTEVIGTGSSAKTKITGIEFADMTDKTLTYLVQVKDGKLDVHDYRLDTNSLAGNAQTISSGTYYAKPYFPILADYTGNTDSPMIYINMVYCGADGDSKSYNPCSHNFVELCNLSNKDLNLKGLYLHYTERNTSNWVSLPLVGVIKAKGTFLIRGAQCSVENINTTYIKVSTYDIIWDKESTYNNTQLEISTESETHSIWDSNNTIKFANNCSFYLSGEPSTDYYKTNVLNLSAPWNTLGTVKWYVDLVGIGSYNSISMPSEGSAQSHTGQNSLLMRYYNMDFVSQAIKASALRSNSTDWTYINLANINPKLSIDNYRPRSSSENKDIFFDKHLLQEGAPNIVTCSFGHNAHTTRCFNWVSVGYYDEYIWFTTTSGDYSDINNKFESFKLGDGRSANGKNWDNTIYNRIRSITTDGTAFTVHKFIKDFTEPTAGTTITYYYKVGRDGFWSSEKSFTLRNRSDVIANGFNYVQVTDQQGFTGEEYESWRLSAEYINQDKATNKYDFCINTGDATQNGNRINEWIDYFNAGVSIFDNTEQMYTVGNNDLCPLDVYTLGVGDDLSKTSPINVQYFFTFEHPYEIPLSKTGVYVPCVYSFVYGNTYFLSMNSEITDAARTNLFGDITGVNVYSNLQSWCTNDLASHSGDTNIAWKIAFCHEGPFSIITQNTLMSYAVKTGDTYTKNSSITRGGSHLNTVGNYWFSQFLQDNNFKLCMGGHKHTYANSRLIREDSSKTMEPIVYDSTYIPDTGSGATYPSWYTALGDREKLCVQLSNNATQNYVKYVMCQATGYKLVSNKELPAINIPWLLEYYPAAQVEDSTTNTAVSTVLAAQKFSHYIIWNVGTGTEVELTSGSTTSRARIKGLAYKLVLTATPTTAWAYKYNTPILLGALSKSGGNGSTHPTNNIIIE